MFDRVKNKEVRRLRGPFKSRVPLCSKQKVERLEAEAYSTKQGSSFSVRRAKEGKKKIKIYDAKEFLDRYGLKGMRRVEKVIPRKR